MNNLRQTLGATHNKPVPAHIEHAIHTIVADNLDLACAVVQKAAAEAAVRTTEEQLSDGVALRKNHRERSGRRLPFYDINVVGSSGYAFAQSLPDSLKPKLGGVTAEQLQVYDDFLAPSTSGVPQALDPAGGGAFPYPEMKGDVAHPGELLRDQALSPRLDTDHKTANWGTGPSDHDDPYSLGPELSEPYSLSERRHAEPHGYLDPSAHPLGEHSLRGNPFAEADLPDVYGHPGMGDHMGLEMGVSAVEGGYDYPSSPSRGGKIDAQMDLMSRTKKIDQFVSELMHALVGLQQIRTLSELPPNHPVVRMFSRVSGIVMSSQNKYAVSVYATQIVFPKLFKRALLHREACLTVIDVLVNVVPAIRMKIAELLINSDPTQKFHREVVPALLHYNLLAIPEYDSHLASLVVARDSLAVDFANYLLQHMIKTSALGPRDLINTLEALLVLSPNGKLTTPLPFCLEIVFLPLSL